VTVEPRKNLHRVIEAFRQLDAAETELILVGPRGWGEDVDVALDGSRGPARTLGYLPRDELDVLYAQAVAVVYPSLAEGFGLPVLEAMANGAAVVTSAGTATEEVAGDAALLVDPLDVDALAEALQRLDDRAFSASLGSGARARASTFTWERSAELAVAVYAEAAEASR
jgi:glycosyltransferase involved in cell wall biosynthesis